MDTESACHDVDRLIDARPDGAGVVASQGYGARMRWAAAAAMTIGGLVLLGACTSGADVVATRSDTIGGAATDPGDAPVVEQPASAVMLRTVSAAAPSRCNTVSAASTSEFRIWTACALGRRSPVDSRSAVGSAGEEGVDVRDGT